MIKPRKLYPFLLLGLYLFACAIPRPTTVCIKNGQKYCVTSDWIYVVDWDSCYRRGLSCMEGGCWENAIDEFTLALSFRNKDKRKARPYGIFFRDYFPHREMGICYLHMGDIPQALDELQLSLSQTPSARAKYYLNQTRRMHLLKGRLDTLNPIIDLEPKEEEFLTDKTPFQLTGCVWDDAYVDSVLINQTPVSIELAEPVIPFTVPIDLKEGLNVIRVAAKDLVNREAEKSIRIFLDRQGPTVIINLIHPAEAQKDQALIKAVVYDESGIISFKLNNQEVQKTGVEQICLIEQAISLPPGIKTVPFWTKDLAGNITQGYINLLPSERRGRKTARLACNDARNLPLSRMEEDEPILFNIIHPPKEEFTTYEQEIHLEGSIETISGIHRIEVNGQKSLNNIQNLIEKNSQKLLRQNIDPQEYYQQLKETIQSPNIYTINQRIPLMEGTTRLALFVEDALGHQEIKYYSITKVNREEVFKSEQRMHLAILPFDVIGDGVCDSECRKYVYDTFIRQFKQKKRFNLIEKKALESMFSEGLIETSCEKSMCDENIAQKIGVGTDAEGIICGTVQKWTGGMEIDAVFRESEKGDNCLFHDAFSPTDTTEDLKRAIFHLAEELHNSFPVRTGRIVDKEGQIINVDIGLKEGLFRGMRYNIFIDEKELITRAGIKDVQQNLSRAEIMEKDKSEEVREGYRVRTR